MDANLAAELQNQPSLLKATLEEAITFLGALPARPVGLPARVTAPGQLPADGLGALAALKLFKDKYARALSGSPGPRYWGFVTGGSTPAALMGDWLTSTFDQNATGSKESAAPWLEAETIGFARQLFGLSDRHAGSFVTGATMANTVGLMLARQWLGHGMGVNVARDGVVALGKTVLFAATPHASIYKALAVAGVGRSALQRVQCLPNREAMDVGDLEAKLNALAGKSAVVVASAGTVNTVDFDDIAALAELKTRYSFWLHVDAAFGGFAACSPKYRSLVNGLDEADSITIDAHKWLNVPYDSAMQFTCWPQLQTEVFQSTAAYLREETELTDYIHRTPENSRRWRALPAWFTLMAYGRSGYREIVERTCGLAQELALRIDQSEEFRLLAPVRLNGICFALAGGEERGSMEAVEAFLSRLAASGQLFLTPTVLWSTPAIRISIVNWRTQEEDVNIAWEALLQAAAG